MTDQKSFVKCAIIVGLFFVLTACGSDFNSNVTKDVTALNAATVTPQASTNRPTATLLANTVTASAGSSTSFSTPPASTVTTDLTSTDWERRWLKNIPCRLPCWEGITPGITKADEALKVFQNNFLIKEPTLSSISYFGENYLLWKWSAPKRDYSDGGFAAYKVNDPTKTIVAIIPKYDPVRFSYKEIVTVFGEPSHVLATARPCSDVCPQYYFNLVYLNQGLKVKLFDNYDRTIKPKIDDQVPYNSIEIFEPGLNGYSKAYTNPKVTGYLVPFEEGKLLVTWQGFKPFEFYCRNLTETGEVEDCTKLLKTAP